MSRRSATAGTIGVVAVGAAIAFAISTSSAVPAQPADTGLSYGSFTGDLSQNPDIAKQLAAGQDPATIPGLRDRSGATREPLTSSEANERRLAEQNYDNGVTYEQDSSQLPSR